MRTVCIALAVISFGLAILDLIQMSDADRQARSANGLDGIPYAMQKQYFKSAANIEFGFGVVFIVITLVVADYESKLRAAAPKKQPDTSPCPQCKRPIPVGTSRCLQCDLDSFKNQNSKPIDKPTPGVKVWGAAD